MTNPAPVPVTLTRFAPMAVATRLILVGAAGLTIFACESTTSVVAPTPVLQLVSGDGQTADGGTALRFPIVVKAVDSLGHPLSGQAIAFTVESGGGTISPKIVTTNGYGFVQASWTLGLDGGPQTLSASVGAGAAVLTVNATANFPRLAFISDPNDLSEFGQWIGIGQYANVLVGTEKIFPLSAPLVVSLAHAAASHSNLPSTVTLQTGESVSLFQIIGTSIGVDSIVASAPGYTPAAMRLAVDFGLIQFGVYGDPPNSTAVGGASEVSLCVQPGLPVEPVTFTLVPSANIRFATDDMTGTVITSVTVAADVPCASLLVQGLAAGPGTVTITSPNYRTIVATINVLP